MQVVSSIWHGVVDFAAAHIWTTKAVALGILGVLLLILLTRLIRRSLDGKIPSHLLILITKVIRYGGLLVIGSSVLTQLGFNITALLGAAGIVGVALGFASQTSVSNIISGMFLILEHPFEMSDVIEVDNAGGRVESIDLLAVRLRTSDGKLVRIPNENLIKSKVINKTFYTARRVSLYAIVDREQNLHNVMEVTQKVLAQSTLIKKEPAPSVSLESTTAWSVELSIWCWVDSRKVVSSTTQIIQDLYEAYKKEGVQVSLRSS